MGPEPRGVEGRDVAAPLLGRGEVGGQAVGVEALAHEVVGRLRRRAAGHAGHPLLVVGQRRVEEHQPLDERRGARGPASGRRVRRGRRRRARPARCPSPSVTSACRSRDVGGDVVEPVRRRRRCRRSRGGRARSRRSPPPPAARSRATRSASSPASRARSSSGTPPCPRARTPARSRGRRSGGPRTAPGRCRARGSSAVPARVRGHHPRTLGRDPPRISQGWWARPHWEMRTAPVPRSAPGGRGGANGFWSSQAPTPRATRPWLLHAAAFEPCPASSVGSRGATPPLDDGARSAVVQSRIRPTTVPTDARLELHGSSRRRGRDDRRAARDR